MLGTPLSSNVGTSGCDSWRVAAVTRLRTTPPFTNLVVDAVRQWSFTAGEGGAILVAAVIRPPALYGPTLGEPPRDVAPGPDRIPFPVATVLPPYPPLARASGVVLVEARVDRAGVVIETTVRRSAPPFDEAACAAVRQWRFRPAVAGGQAVSSVAYVLLGFPTPVTTPPIKK